jgi:hypothetical protein
MHHSRSHGWLLACFACLLGQSYYAAVLGCDAVTTGKHLAVTGVVRFIGNFLGATLETTLQKLGFKQLNIRKSVCLVNNTLQAGFCLGFGLSRTPLMATIMNCGVCLCDCFQGIGFSQNYYEVGGPDTATLTSVGNVFASLGEQRASERAIATQRNVSVRSVLFWSGLVLRSASRPCVVRLQSPAWCLGTHSVAAPFGLVPTTNPNWSIEDRIPRAPDEMWCGLCVVMWGRLCVHVYRWDGGAAARDMAAGNDRPMVPAVCNIRDDTSASWRAVFHLRV